MKSSFLSLLFAVLVLFPFLGCQQSKEKEGPETKIVDTDTVSNMASTSDITKLFPRFEVTEYCKAKDQEMVYKEMAQYGKKTPFGINVEQKEDKLYINYSVIDDCCLKFKAQATLESKKLNLFHLIQPGDVCECKCKYEMSFILAGFDTVSKNIFINKQPINY